MGGGGKGSIGDGNYKQLADRKLHLLHHQGMHVRAATTLCERPCQGWGLQGQGSLRAFLGGQSQAGTSHPPALGPAHGTAVVRSRVCDTHARCGDALEKFGSP